MRQCRIAKLDADVVDRQAEHVGRDLRHDRVSPGADIGGRGRDFRVAIGRQHDADRGRHLQRFPYARRHAPADQFTAVAHRARLGVALVPAERRGALPVAFAQLLAGIGNILALVAVGIALQAQLHRIDLERDGEFVHRAFQRIDAGRRARGAHVAGGRHVELDELVLEFRVGALVKQVAPAGIVAREFLELRGHGDRLMRHRVERAAAVGAEREAFDGRGPVAERIHLRARQHDAYRALERARAQHRQHDLVLRAQAGPKAAAHIGRHDANLVRLHIEHAAEILLDVLHALRLVVHRELAVVPHRRRGEQFHRIVVLGRNEIFGHVAHSGGRKSLLGIAARLCRRVDGKRLAALRVQIGNVRLLLVFDPDQRGGDAGGFPILRQHQRERLSAEMDLVVVERAIG